MASVNRVKYGPYRVTWHEGGAEQTSTHSTRKEAERHASGIPASVVTRDQGEGPVRWEVTYRDLSGRGRSKRFDRKGHADRFAADVESEKARGTFVDPRAGKTTFAEYATDWLAARELADTSRERMRNQFEVNVFPYLGHLPLARIEPETIQRWLADISHLAASTRHLTFKHVKAVLTAAVDNGRIARNPCAAASVKAAKPKSVAKRIVPWTHHQVLRMHEAMPDRYALLVLLGAGLGLRQGETFGLSPDDFDLEASTVRIKRQVVIIDSTLAFAAPKSGSERSVPLPDSIRDAVLAYLTEFHAELVTLPWSDPTRRSATKHLSVVSVPLLVTSRQRKACNRNYVNDNVWKPALVQAGIAPTRENGSHALRHYYASVLLNQGASIRVVSEYLGHHDPSFTLRTYTHLMRDSEATARDAIDRVFTDLAGSNR